MDTRPRTSLISFCTVHLRTLCIAHSLATLCLFTTSGPDPGEFPGFWGSMVFHHAPIPRKGLRNQQQQNDLVQKLLKYLEDASSPAYEIMKRKFDCVLQALEIGENVRKENLTKEFEACCRELIVIGFISASYELNLIKPTLIQQLFDKIDFVIKKANNYFFFFIYHMYPPFTRKRCIAMCWTVSPHSLESCLFRVTCLPHKGGASR